MTKLFHCRVGESHRLQSLLLLLLLIGVGVSPCFGQDEIDVVKSYPPESIAPKQLASTLEQLEWQATQLQARLDYHRVERERLEGKIHALTEEVNRLHEQLPVVSRFVDAEARSNLVERVMQVLLDSRLEVASGEAGIKALEETLANAKGGKAASLKIKDAMISVRAAERERELADQSFSRQERLYKKKFVPEETFQRTRFTLEIADLKLDKAKNDLELATLSIDEPLAAELSQRRLALTPIKAKIRAAEEYLDQFVSATETSNQIEVRRRKIRFIELELEQVVAAMATVRSEAGDIAVLQDLIKQRMKAAEADAEKE